MNGSVSLKTLLAIIVIGGLILGIILVGLTKKFSSSISGLKSPISEEQAYLNVI